MLEIHEDHNSEVCEFVSLKFVGRAVPGDGQLII